MGLPSTPRARRHRLGGRRHPLRPRRGGGRPPRPARDPQRVVDAAPRARQLPHRRHPRRPGRRLRRRRRASRPTGRRPTRPSRRRSGRSWTAAPSRSSFAGEHSLLLPILTRDQRPPGPVGLIQVDAHADTQDSYYGGERHTAGSVIRRCAEAGCDRPRALDPGGHARARSTRPRTATTSRSWASPGSRWTTSTGWGSPPRPRRSPSAAAAGPVYLSFDMDAVDPAFAPGTGRREPGGFTLARGAVARPRAAGAGDRRLRPQRGEPAVRGRGHDLRAGGQPRLRVPRPHRAARPRR